MNKDMDNLLDIADLCVYFKDRGATLRAVDGVSLVVRRGEKVGLVGESGSGKSTIGRAILKLVPIHSGSIRIAGKNTGSLKGQELKTFRRTAQMVFQDPFGSLNPRMTIGMALAEPLAIHFKLSATERRVRVAELLKSVELAPDVARRYPHEFSGGQRQRIGMARALATDPTLLIADEPVSALDVSVQAQVLNLLKALCVQRQITLLLIAHDLAVVRYMCDRVLVMYHGRIVESGPADALLIRPAHPYTAALLAAAPDVRQQLEGSRPADTRVALSGDVPLDVVHPTGCALQVRCPRAMPCCAVECPTLREIGPGRWIACHLNPEPFFSFMSLPLRQLKKIVILILGGSVLLVGVIMIVTPGPAFIVIPAGLVILAAEFEWARRLLKRVRALCESQTEAWKQKHGKRQ